jgi:hypothetical protein
MKGRTPLSTSMMAADKIRPAAIKVGIRLELSSWQPLSETYSLPT